MTDSEGSFSSPNYPGSYPPNSLCVWVIRVPPPNSVQIHVSSLTVEGPSPCLFDWLEVQEQIEQSSVITRSVGSQGRWKKLLLSFSYPNSRNGATLFQTAGRWR